MCEGQLVGRGFLVAADEEDRPREGGSVPGLAVEDSEAGELAVRLGAGLDQHHLSLLRLHEQQVAGEDDLAVAVAPGLPPPLAALRAEAPEDAAVAPVDEAVVRHQVRELRLEAGGPPPRVPPPAPARRRPDP